MSIVLRALQVRRFALSRTLRLHPAGGRRRHLHRPLELAREPCSRCSGERSRRSTSALLPGYLIALHPRTSKPPMPLAPAAPPAPPFETARRRSPYRTASARAAVLHRVLDHPRDRVLARRADTMWWWFSRLRGAADCSRARLSPMLGAALRLREDGHRRATRVCACVQPPSRRRLTSARMRRRALHVEPWIGSSWSRRTLYRRTYVAHRVASVDGTMMSPGTSPGSDRGGAAARLQVGSPAARRRVARHGAAALRRNEASVRGSGLERRCFLRSCA